MRRRTSQLNVQAIASYYDNQHYTHTRSTSFYHLLSPASQYRSPRSGSLGIVLHLHSVFKTCDQPGEGLLCTNKM